MADALEYGAPPAGMSFCIPLRVNQGQLRDITVAWLDKNPQYRHFQAHLLVTKALHETFPCKK